MVEGVVHRQNVTKRVLQRARDLVAAGWCKGAYARDKHRHPLEDVSSPRACKFCATGAILRAEYEMDECLVSVAEAVLRDVMDVPAVPNFNDNRTKKQVLQKFDEAIASL